MTLLAPLLEAFFSERLHRQMQASPNTVTSYRDSFCLLLRFAQRRLGKAPSTLLLTDLHASFVGEFLDSLEQERHNGARSRNARLAAIHSFFHYIATREPAHSALIQRVLAIPQKRSDRNIVCFLTRSEIDALIAMPDRTTWIGCRDLTLLAVAIQTGLRVSELVGLRIEDVVLTGGAHVYCRGKGRKERCTPLTRQSVALVAAWIRERGVPNCAFLFPSRRGTKLSRDAVERLVHNYATRAQSACPSLAGKRVSPHVLRHTTAVHLLQAGVDRSVIALWLGHESMETTQIYLDADLAMKERALACTTPSRVDPGRFRPDDSLLAFLRAL